MWGQLEDGLQIAHVGVDRSYLEEAKFERLISFPCRLSTLPTSEDRREIDLQLSKGER